MKWRADIVGSFKEPAYLIEAYERHGEGRATDDELRAVQDEAVADLIAKEEAHGLPVVSDGEFRRIHFQESFANAVSGYDAPRATIQSWRAISPLLPPAPVTAEIDTASGASPGQAATAVRVPHYVTSRGPAIITRCPANARLQLVRNVPLEEYRLAAPIAKKATLKVTLVGPDRIAQRFDYERSTGVYSGLDDFVGDVVKIQRKMVDQLAEAGCRYIQQDEPGFTAYVDGPSLEAMRSRGEDPKENLARSIRADNEIIAGHPGVTFGVHICRGNPTGGFHREGHYDAIAEQLFGELRHDRLLVEYDDPNRAGSFEPLRFVRKETTVVLGLISTKIPRLETVDELARRIDEASKYVPLERLALSPQCGFGHFAEEIQWRKVDRLMETVARVWG